MAKIRVLLVEDERIVALHLQKQLRLLGYDVVGAASSGDQALKRITALSPDVVLMDIHIQGPMDGIDTAARIPAEMEVPVIYLTAYSDETTIARARATKPYGYLIKPFNERELHATIQTAMERRKSEIETRAQERQLERRVQERTSALADALRRLEAEMAARETAVNALRQSHKMDALGQLTGGIAHDFNNILSVIMGNLDLVRFALEPGSPILPRIERAIWGVEHAASLTERLLSFARRQPLVSRPIIMSELLPDLVELLRHTLGEDIAVHVTIDPGVWVAMADSTQLETTILNLVLNARDAMPAGGRVGIAVTNAVVDREDAEARGDIAPGDYVMIAVTDTGTGMPESVLARAFEPFFTTKDEGQGTGLGLAMVYGFVKQSGGHVTIESVPGQGTTVRLYLPRAGISAQPVLVAPAPRDIRKHGSATVLVVEDEPSVREIVCAILLDLGYEVLEAGDGAEALEVFAAHEDTIDLLLTDVRMPGAMKGDDVARHLTQRRPDLAVLFMSGHTDKILTDRARANEITQLIKKPIHRALLERAVNEALSERAA